MTRTPVKRENAATRRAGRPRLKHDPPLTPAERQSRYRTRRSAALAELQAAIDNAAARGVPIALAAKGGLAGVAAPTERINALARAIRGMKGRPVYANGLH